MPRESWAVQRPWCWEGTWQEGTWHHVLAALGQFGTHQARARQPLSEPGGEGARKRLDKYKCIFLDIFI